MAAQPYDDPQVLPSALTASAGQRRIALGVSLLLLAAFVATIPFARTALARVPNFVMAQQSVLLVTELITAGLLFAQYAVKPSGELQILAAGYLFTALLLIPHTLMLPGAFSQTGLLNAGAQSSAWLYLASRVLLPLSIIVYALRRHDGDTRRRIIRRPGVDIPAAISVVVAAVAALALLVSVGHEWLPPVMAGDRFTTNGRVAVGVLLALVFAAMGTLARRRPPSVLDLWLTVVMLAWACTAILDSLIDSGRYELGYYAGRIYAVFASCIVLIVLLSEIMAVYADLLRLATIEHRERERRLKEMEAILIHVAGVGDLNQIASSLVHEVIQPLTAISNYLRAGMRLARAHNTAELITVLERSAEQADRASGIIRHLRSSIAKHETEMRVEKIPEVLGNAVRLALVGVHTDALVIEMNVAPAASSALFDRIQIEQVVFNLVRNAIEAMEGTRRVLTVGANMGPNNMVEISVGDTGNGLSPDIREQLFRPFVTTKTSGLGIGLSICRFIVEEHGGQLQAEDNRGGGTIFRFTLPREPTST